MNTLAVAWQTVWFGKPQSNRELITS